MPIAAALLPVFALIAGGAVFGRLRRIGGEGVAALNAFTIWLALPALLFRSLAERGAAGAPGAGFVAAFALGVAATLLLGLLAAPRAGGARPPLPDRTLSALAGSYANTAFIGIPVAGGLFGAAGLAAAVAASLLTISLLFAICVLLTEIGLHGRGALGALPRVAAGVLRNPLVASPLAGALWRAAGLAMPLPLARTLDLLAAAASPCALVGIGASLALPRPAGVSSPGIATARTVALKLVAQPALTALAAFALLPALGHPLRHPWDAAAVLIAALPTGTGPFMLAALYGRGEQFAARAILLSTIGGAITVPAVALLLVG